VQWKADGNHGPFDERMRAVEGALAQGRLPTRSVEQATPATSRSPLAAVAATPRSPVVVPPRSPVTTAPRSPVAAKPGASPPRSAAPGGADVAF
jgi:hypothetical protein